MKRILSYAVCVAIIISSVLCGAVVNTAAQSGKILYTDFSTQLIVDTPVASGNGDHTISLYSGYTVSDFVQKDGVLSMKISNGNYVRFANTLDLKNSDVKYMVVRMKGTNDWGAGLTGNALKFWFGSWGVQGSGIYMSHTQLTEDYSEAVLTIPDGYFDSLSSTDLFITSERGAIFDVSIDEIYFCKNYPVEEEPEEVFEKHIYSDFNQELVLNSPVVSDGADGRITLFHAELCTPTVSDGSLKISYNTPDSYVRFTNTLALTDSTKTSIYKYIVLRMKGTAAAKDGTPYTSGRLLNIIIGNWGNEANPIVMDASLLNTGDYVDVVLELKDINFAGTANGYESGLIIKNGANIDAELDIDEIYFCDTLPLEDSEEEDVNFIYSEFTDALVEGTAVPNGADGTITLFATENATQSVADGKLNVSITSNGYIRFTSSLALTDDCKTAKYKYMVIKLKGSGTRSDGSAVTDSLVNVIFGSWGNEGNPVVISGSQINADDFTTLVLELNDKNFANTHTDYASGLIFRNAGIFNTDIVIDTIYFTDVKPEDDMQPDGPEAPEETTDFIYSEFTDALVEGTAVPNGADGTITLFATENATQSVADGKLNVSITSNGYIRFTSSLALTDDCKTAKYKYMVIKLKGSATRSDGSAVTDSLVNVIFGSWGNEGNPVVISGSQINADDFTTLVLELNDKNFANTHTDYVSGLIFRNAGIFNTDIVIDTIYFTDVKPEDDMQPDGPEAPEETTDFIYSEFTDALVEGTAVPNGADGTITLFASENATQSVADGKLNLSINADGYIRFTSSLALTDDCKTAKYKYMVIKLKGSASKADGSAVTGDLLKVIFGSWGNEGNPVVISGSQINADDFTTLVLELNDKNFANTHTDYASGLIFRNAGNFNSSIEIDSIYFTDVKPATAPLTPQTPSGVATKDKVYYSNFETPLVEGMAVSNGDDGTVTLFNMIGCTQSVSNGALNLKLSGEGAYARFSSSLVLTEDCKTSKYKYMVVKIKGSAVSPTGSAAVGSVLKFIMGSWGNEGNPLLLQASNLTSGYNTIVFDLQDKNFASTHTDYVGGLIIQNGGNFVSDVTIDEIYFTDVKPTGVVINTDSNSGGNIGASGGSASDNSDNEENSGESAENSGDKENAPSKDADNKQKAVGAFSDGNPTIGLVILVVFAAVIIAFCVASTLIIFRGRKLKAA